MNDNVWMNWVGKKCKIILKNNFEYNCVINSVHDSGNGLIWIEITDKFGEIKMFASNEIKLIEEKK